MVRQIPIFFTKDLLLNLVKKFTITSEEQKTFI